MIAQPGGGSRPVPDPTELTDRAIARLEKALTEYIDGQLGIRDERLNGIDEATKLRLDQVSIVHESVQHDIDRAVTARSYVVDERFAGVQVQFKERDTRQETVALLGQTALAAAFAAQKEQAAAENKANREAIDKSERATAETIKTNQELSTTRIDNVIKDLDALKLAVNSILASRTGAVEQRTATTENRGAIYATVGVIISIVLVCITIIGAIAALKP